MSGSKIVIGMLIGCIGAALPMRCEAEPAEVTDEAGQGWTPAQANAWMGAQMDYAHAVKQYGKDSPEATQAQVMMNTLARQLGIKASAEVPEVAPPAEMLPPAPEEKEEAAAEAPKNESPELNTPAPENVANVQSEPAPAPTDPGTP